MTHHMLARRLWLIACVGLLCNLSTARDSFFSYMWLQTEKSWFTGEIDRLQTKLTEEPLPMGSELSNFRSSSSQEYKVLYQLEDDIVKLKCYLASSVQQWNLRLDDIVKLKCHLGCSVHQWFVLPDVSLVLAHCTIIICGNLKD